MKAGRKKHGCQREPLFCQLQLLLACSLASKASEGPQKEPPPLGNLVITERGVSCREISSQLHILSSPPPSGLGLHRSWGILTDSRPEAITNGFTFVQSQRNFPPITIPGFVESANPHLHCRLTSLYIVYQSQNPRSPTVHSPFIQKSLLSPHPTSVAAEP